ncbi:hypothetical protein O5282_00030 [Escherichia coli]|nr:hypothetical protein [Escherichia coli]
MPHCDSEVIRRARALVMYCAPRVATPTEAFAAIEHGANAIKLFPAEQITPEVTKSLGVRLFHNPFRCYRLAVSHRKQWRVI